ncbi:MAG: gamma-glutamylcyclotransferase [Gammaproteobacteria bacterium]|jgi:gamma-glutamylcyclotransferase (GGCT)/AIG2-like uncharacterized protein YtfP|nr:gamma-glutamylcyclotransferase [Gammaproteobacteria bacterium]MBT6043695.1 gamma-glutamylcyclotransferase [Gammaproteobacteria bacterium]
MPDSVDYLFVYGTLRSDTYSDSYRQLIAPEFTLISRATIPGKLYLIADYPGLLPAEKPTDLVVGEVYSFTGSELQLADIDDYEGCGVNSQQPHLYRRIKESVALQDGTTISAWTYFYNFSINENMLIRSGDFLDPV